MNRHKYYDDVVKMAQLFTGFYTGKGLNHLITSYRTKENEAQKSQRLRVGYYRTKLVTHKIKNILQQLKSFDKAAISIMYNNEVKLKELKNIVYENNIETQAFSNVLTANLIDPNSFLVFGMEGEDYTFKRVPTESVMDYKVVNDEVIYLTIKHTDKLYRKYTKDRIEEINHSGQITDTISTPMCYAYNLGYIIDDITNCTYVSLLNDVSEELKMLLIDGFEYDVIKSTHGIVKRYVYSDDCNYSAVTEKGVQNCSKGNVYCGNELVGQCQQCNGTGVKLHTSSQDILYYRKPANASEGVPLNQMAHTEYIDPNILEARKKDIKDLTESIINGVFQTESKNQTSANVTATEVVADMKGEYSVFYSFGQKVSDTFIWMVKAIGSSLGIDTTLSVFHGYSMDLNFDTIENLLAQRKVAVDAGASPDIINVIDQSILKKQHMDNPMYLRKYEIWESLRPFRDKSEQERIGIVAMLPANNEQKLIYTYFSSIKADIEHNEPTFYELSFTDQKLKVSQYAELYREVETNNDLTFGN